MQDDVIPRRDRPDQVARQGGMEGSVRHGVFGEDKPLTFDDGVRIGSDTKTMNVGLTFISALTMPGLVRYTGRIRLGEIGSHRCPA